MEMNAPLTPTERKIAEYYADGASFSEIAALLGRSPHTVRSHLKNIYRKLGVDSKIALYKHLDGLGHVHTPQQTSSLEETRKDWALYRSAVGRARKFTWQDQAEAKCVFRELQERHPNFCGAHSGLSFIAGYTAFATSCASDASELLSSAVAHAETALSLNAFDCEAHLSMGRALVFEGDWGTGEAHIRFALECDHGSEWAQYMLTFVLTHKGEPAEAVKLGEKFQRRFRDRDVVEPMSLTLACACLHNNDLESAADWAWSIIERNRAYGHLVHTACAILAEADRFAEVEAFARHNYIDLCDLTPIQYQLHARNGTVVDLMARHRSRLEGLFSHRVQQRVFEARSLVSKA